MAEIWYKVRIIVLTTFTVVEMHAQSTFYDSFYASPGNIIKKNLDYIKKKPEKKKTKQKILF